MTSLVHSVYRRHIRPRIRGDLNRQRFKLLWDVWGYWPLLFMQSSWRRRIDILFRFLRVDWFVLHAHKPSEISRICRALGDRPARPNEVIVEAGCWRGGSSAKFSVVARLLGYRFLVFDSFEGVEAVPDEASYHDFSGSYRASLEEWRETVARFGELKVTEVRKGWFSDTLKPGSISSPIRLVYIDCDLAKGTREVLSGVLPALVDDALVYSQDFHIKPVQDLVTDTGTWARLGVEMPRIVPVARNTVRIDIRKSFEGVT